MVELHFYLFLLLLAVVSFIWMIVSDGSGMTVLCRSISMFHIFHKDVQFLKRGIVGNVLGYFMWYVLTKVYLTG